MFTSCLLGRLTLTGALLLGAAAANAQLVLLTDNFTGTGSPNTLDLNYNLAGRQTGSLAPVTYTLNPGGNCQVGNTGEPHDSGNVLLCAFGSNGALDLNFNGRNSAGGLRLSFDMDPNPHSEANLTDWAAVTLGSAAGDRNTFVVSGTPHFGILFRANGRIQAFDGGSVVSPDPEPNWAPDGDNSGQLHHFDLLITDPNDGNPFDGSGDTQIDVYVDGGFAPVYSFTKSGGYADNYINFQGAFIVDFENIEIAQPNPPATPPEILRQPVSQCVSPDLTVTFTVQASGNPPPDFQWRYNGTPLAGEINSTLTLPAVQDFDAGVYDVVVSNAGGSVTSDPASLGVGLAMMNPSFEADSFAVFPGYVTQNGPITGWTALGGHGVNPGVGFSPFADNGTIPNGEKVAFMQQDGALSQTISGFTVGGQYVVVYQENARSGNTPAVEVTVGGHTVVPAHVVSSVGGANPYHTTFSEVFIADATDLELAFIKSNPLGGDTTALIDNVCVLEIPAGTAPKIVRQPESAIAQTDESVTFSVQAIGSLPLSYQWRKDGGNIAGANAPTLTLNNIQKTDEAVYSVRIANTAGDAASVDAQLTVFEPIPGLFNTGVNDSRVASADGVVDPHYTIITNPDSASPDAIVEDSTVFPIVTGPWLANTAVSKWVGPRLETSGGASGDYVYRTTFDLTGRDASTVIIIGRWSTDNAGLDIIVNGTPTGIPQPEQFVAWHDFRLDRSNATFNNGPNTIDFVLNNSAVGYTGLRVEILHSNVRIPPGTPPAITAQPQGAKLVQGDSVTLAVSATGTAPLHYQWQKSGVDLPGQTGPTLTLLDVTIADSANYTVVVNNLYGTVTSDKATVCVCWLRIPGIYGTGVDDAGGLLADGVVDSHYLLVASDDPNYPGPDAKVVNEGWPISPAGPWVANGPRSRWIAPRAEQNQQIDPTFGNAAGNYTFELMVDLTGFDVSQVSLAGQWAVDNLGTDILVNGLSTGITSPGFGGYTPFLFTADSGLVAGINTLDFVVNNLPNTPNPAGLRVDLTARINIQPTLHIEPSGADVIVSWSPVRPGQRLQSAPTVAGPWQNIAAAVSPHTTAAAGAARFFRVVE